MPGRFGEAAPQPLESTVSRDAILEQLDRILASSLFKHSKRCGPLLKYIVTETTDGRAEHLKERVIGVAVFGRKPTYDTNDDPIVRTSAVEVRKRIAQFYHEAGHEAEVRIDLTSGSYIPKFRPPAAEPVIPLLVAPETPLTNQRTATALATDEHTAIGTAVYSIRKRLLVSAVTLGGVIIAVAIGLLARSILASGPVNDLWGPLLSSETITLVMGNVEELAPQVSTAGVSHEPSFFDTIQADRVGFVDGLTIARVAALLRSKGKKFDIRRGGSLTLQDLRKTPAVMVGALNNPWTERLEERLRFRFAYDDATHTTYLHDQQNPAQPLWRIDRDAPYSTLKEDRAIISRFVDSRTEQTVLLLAGFGRDGTAAAGEFVTEPNYLRQLGNRAPRGWQGKNLQAVIATDLINGHSGPPRLVTTYFW